jgi:hypothetical protein
MEPIITKLIVKRFRSFPNEVATLGNPTFLVGRNGAGKSNFADLFSFVGEAMSSPLQAVFDRRGGVSAVRNRSSGRSYPPNMGVGIYLGAINGQIRSAHFSFEIKALPNCPTTALTSCASSAPSHTWTAHAIGTTGAAWNFAPMCRGWRLSWSQPR